MSKKIQYLTKRWEDYNKHFRIPVIQDLVRALQARIAELEAIIADTQRSKK